LSSVFNRVYSLMNRGQGGVQEDFLTELVAEVFESENALRQFFNLFTKAKIGPVADVSVSTQRSFPKILDHDSESIPDITLRFNDGSEKYIAFFENKVDAMEGKDQLRRYADHLRAYQDAGYKTWLFYITRRDDPKSKSKIFKNGVSAKFVQLRWYQIVEWLNGLQGDSYSRKLVEYMEEIQLNNTRRFVPQDIYALQHMNRLQRMMDDCLDGPVETKMKNLFGQNVSWSNRSTQLRDNNRYMKLNEQVTRHFYVGCGFQFNATDFPTVIASVEVSPTSPHKQSIQDAMKSFLIGRID
jgi:hypothetical protein